MNEIRAMKTGQFLIFWYYISYSNSIKIKNTLKRFLKYHWFTQTTTTLQSAENFLKYDTEFSRTILNFQTVIPSYNK